MGYPPAHPLTNSLPRLTATLCLLLLIPVCLVSCDKKDNRASSRAAAYVDKARFAYRKGQLEDALILTQGAIRALPENPQGYLLQAKIQYDLNLLEKAAKSIDLAIKYIPRQDPQLADAYLDQGIYLRALQRDPQATTSLNEAQALYRKQLATNPDDQNAAVSLALLDHMWDNDKAALERINAMLEKHPNHDRALKLKQTIQVPHQLPD